MPDSQSWSLDAFHLLNIVIYIDKLAEIHHDEIAYINISKLLVYRYTSKIRKK